MGLYAKSLATVLGQGPIVSLGGLHKVYRYMEWWGNDMNRVPGRSDWSIRKSRGSEGQSRSEYEFMPSVSATKSVRKTSLRS